MGEEGEGVEEEEEGEGGRKEGRGHGGGMLSLGPGLAVSAVMIIVVWEAWNGGEPDIERRQGFQNFRLHSARDSRSTGRTTKKSGIVVTVDATCMS